MARHDGARIHRTGQHQAGGGGVAEAVGAVVLGLADHDAELVAQLLGRGQAVAHQRLADAAALQRRLDRQRAQQDRRGPLDQDRPEAQRGDHLALEIERHEGELGQRRVVLAQPIYGAAGAAGTERAVQQRVDLGEMGRGLGLDRVVHRGLVHSAAPVS
jgi:hypothetical protein